MTWSQNYAPLGSVGVSALVAVLPVVTLLGLLGLVRLRAHFAALAGLFVAALIAVVVYRMPPQLTLAAAIYGGAFGLFPIGWILLNAIFIYNLSVESGQFAVLQNQLCSPALIDARKLLFCLDPVVVDAQELATRGSGVQRSKFCNFLCFRARWVTCLRRGRCRG